MAELNLNVKIGWRRQHPEFENLLWCPACGQYKDRGEFGANKSTRHGVNTECRQCCSYRNADYNLRNPEVAIEGSRRWRAANPDKARKSVRKWSAANRDTIRERERKYIANLADYYIRSQLRLANLPITPETIELKRAQIQMRRTLKEFKKWNEENLKQEGGI